MKRLLLSIFLSMAWLFSVGQGTIITSPPLTPNNGSGGITFQVQSNSPVEITGISNIFSTGETSANVWVRIGGVSPSGAPNVSTAGGWTQVITGGAVAGANNTALVPIAFGTTKIAIPANTPVGIHIEGNTRYMTGTATNQVTYTDGTLTVNVADSVAYGGNAPSPTFNPRRFVGSVTYALGVTGNCTPFTNFQIDSISANAAKVNWVSGSGNTGYKIEYGTTGFTPGTGTTVTGTYPTSPATPPVVLTGLTPNTGYDVYFEEYCSGPDTVRFPTPQSFTTTKLCSAPTAFVDSNLTSNTVDVGWAQTGTFNESWVMWGPAGTTPGSTGWMVDTIMAPTTTHTIMGLSPSTAYDIYVATDCGATNGVSDTVGPISITTPIQGPQGITCTTGSPGILFSDDFEVQGGWTGNFGTGATATNWNYRTGGTGSSGTGPSGAHSGSTYIYTETSGTPGGANIEAISPRIDLSTSFNSAELSFWIHAYGSGIDTVQVQVGNSVNGPWSTVFTNVGQIQTANADPWQNVGVSLDNYVGQAIHLRFLVIHGSGFTGDVGIDLVEVNSCQTCPFPGNPTITFIGSDSAYVSWTGSGTAYDVNWGPLGFTQGSPSSTFDSTMVNGIGIGGLTGNTAYDLYLRNDCSDSANGTSGWVGPLSFVTLCNPLTAPYFNNFDTDSIDAPPICWDNAIIGGTNAQFPNADVEVLPTFYTAQSAPNAVRFYNYNTDTIMLISPQFSDMSAGDKRINFYAFTTTTATGNTLEIGTMATPGDRTSYVALDTVTLSNSYQQFFLDLTTASGYNGTHEFLAFRHIGPNFRTYFIDDFTYEAIPACNPPLSSSLGVTGVGVTTAVGVWGSGSDGDATIIEWGTTGFTPGAGSGIGRDTVGGNVDTYNMTGMAAQTTYDFYIADSCAASGLSPWVGPFTFTTACNIFSAPYLEEFDGVSWVAGTGFNNAGATLDPCWSEQSNGTVFRFLPRATAPGSGNGPLTDVSGTGNYMYCEASGAASGDTSLLSMPIVDVSSLVAPALYFYQHRYSNGSIADMRVDVTNDFGASWTTVYTVQGDIQTSSGDAWSEVFVNLPQFVGDTIQVRFVQESNGCCGDAAIDSVAIAEAPSCPDPNNLMASNVSDTSATFSWVAANNAQVNQFWFGPAGFYQGTTTTGGTQVNLGTGTSINIDTLDPQTCYDFLVRTACGPGDTSMWVGPIQVCTQCAAISAPHYENWDNLVAQSKDLGCYSGIEGSSLQGSNFLGVTIQNSTFYAPPTGPNYVEIDNSNNVSDDLILVSPLTNDMTDGNKRVRFTSREISAFNSAELMVGTMSDPTNPNTFNALDTINPTTTWVEYTVNLDAANGYNGTDLFFAFAHDLGGTFDAIFIDEVRYEQIPTCISPTTLAITSTSITDTSATATWVGASTGTNFQIEYGIGPLGDPGNTRVLNTGSSINLTGLTPGSGYCVWVREICTPGDTSYWTGPVCFATLCPTTGYMAPYFTNFEGISIGTASGTPAGWENCWTHNTISGSVRWESEDASGFNENSLGTGPFYDATFFPSSGGTYMYLETSTSGGPAELTSPLIDISGLNNPELYYHYHMFGATINYMLIFAEDASGTRTLLDSIAGQQQTAQSDSFYLRNVPLTALTGSLYNFVFQGHRGTSFTGDIAIDDVGVGEGVSCPPPVALTQTGANLSDVTVTWAGGGGTYEMEYGVAGFARGSGTTVLSVTSPYTITSLSAATAYDFYVREICSPGDTSGWSAVGQASTLLCNASSQCTFNFDLLDTFGDGWNGAEITIYQNGVEVGKMGNGFTTGGLFQDSIDLCNGLNTAIVLTTAGGWPSEIGLDVFDPNGANVGTYAASPSTAQGDTLVQFQANCGFPCPDPTGLAATANVGCDSIEVAWTSSTGGSIIEYGPAGFAPGSGTMTGVVTSPYTIPGLNANTAYDVYVADTCSGDTSSFITTSITTANAPQPTAGFTWTNAINGNQFILYVDASSSVDAGSYTWDFGNGVTGSGMMDTVIFLGNGQYTVLLTVTNACGTDTISQVINVNIGLEDNPLSNSLNVYPNPANHKVNVSFREVGSGDVEIRLRDAQGREVIFVEDRMESGKYSKDIDVSNLARGIYMVEVRSGGLTAHRRLSIR